MAKRSQKRRLKHVRGQAGCMWGLISMFDFRQGRSTKRLLSDRSHVNKQVVGDGYSSDQCKSLVDAEESKMPMLDVAKTSVKELMEEEMFNEQGPEKHNDSGISLERSNSNNGNHLKRRQKKRSRSRVKSCDLDVSAEKQSMPENRNQVPQQRLFDSLDLELIMEELAHMNQRNANGLKNDIDIRSSQPITVVEENLIEAIKLLAEQRLSCSKRFGEDGSNELMDALKMLSLNKDALLKLLQDPDSKLVKRVQNLENARLDGDQAPNSSPVSNFSEDNPGNLKADESSSRKHRNFFRRRTKSLESYPFGGDKDAQSHNKIVILKPGQAGPYSPQTDTGVSSDRNASQFSFTEIKRKFRHAIGKERQVIPPDRLNLRYSPKNQYGNNSDKGSSGENFGWSSPNRNHFYTERFLTSPPSFKKGETVANLAGNESSPYSRLRGSNIYIEAKKHLSDMLNHGGEKPESVTRQLPKSLGRILSLPEYSGSPCCSSPRKYGDDIFIRLSPRAMFKRDLSGTIQENSSNYPSPRKQHLESQRVDSTLDTNGTASIRVDREHSAEIVPVVEDTFVAEVHDSPAIVMGVEETTKSKYEEEGGINTSSIESSGDVDEEDIVELDNTQGPSQLLKDSSPCFELPISSDNQVLSSSPESPPRCRISSEIEDSNRKIDKMERPSPISVLEPLFTDDDISPASTTSQSVEKDIEPRHIHFEEQSSASDQAICTRISLEDEESAFEYVEAVLLGSGLNWDEFLLRWISMRDILDSSLFDEVEIFSGRPCHDQKLLFDCASDALEELCELYFGCFSHDKMKIKPAPKGMDLIQEIWRRVEWDMFQLPQPHSLEQLVKADLARSRKWMNIESDIDHIVSEMGETIFTELVDEMVLSFANEDAY